MSCISTARRCFTITYCNFTQLEEYFPQKSLGVRSTKGLKFHLVEAISYFANRFCWCPDDFVQTNVEAVTRQFIHCNRISPQQDTSLTPVQIVKPLKIHPQRFSITSFHRRSVKKGSKSVLNSKLCDHMRFCTPS